MARTPGTRAGLLETVCCDPPLLVFVSLLRVAAGSCLWVVANFLGGRRRVDEAIIRYNLKPVPFPSQASNMCAAAPQATPW